jgi:hypothetical protein
MNHSAVTPFCELTDTFHIPVNAKEYLGLSYKRWLTIYLLYGKQTAYLLSRCYIEHDRQDHSEHLSRKSRCSVFT